MVVGRWDVRLDIGRYQDERGVVDLDRMRRDSRWRQHARVQGVLAVASLVVLLVGGSFAAITVSVQSGGQVALLGLALTWLTGCVWIRGSWPGTTAAAWAHRLMPLAAIPSVLVAVLSTVV